MVDFARGNNQRGNKTVLFSEVIFDTSVALLNKCLSTYFMADSGGGGDAQNNGRFNTLTMQCLINIEVGSR